MPAPSQTEAVTKHRRVANMVDLLEDLEKNYTDMLHMFMNTSRRLVENASFVQAMVDATKDVDNDDLRRVAAVKGRLQRSLTSVREDFVKQTQQIVDSPVFSPALKKKVKELRENTMRLDDSTKEGLYGGGRGRKKATPAAAAGGQRRRRAAG